MDEGARPLNGNPGSRAEEAELAWALTQAAHPHLDVVQRHDIYITIGVGETFSAISSLIAAVVGRQLMLPADLVDRVAIWLDAYVGNDGEPHLRRLIGQLMSHPLDRGSPEMGIAKNRNGDTLGRPPAG